jgi:hypothetical protein
LVFPAPFTPEIRFLKQTEKGLLAQLASVTENDNFMEKIEKNGKN